METEHEEARVPSEEKADGDAEKASEKSELEELREKKRFSYSRA